MHLACCKFITFFCCCCWYSLNVFFFYSSSAYETARHSIVLIVCWKSFDNLRTQSYVARGILIVIKNPPNKIKINIYILKLTFFFWTLKELILEKYFKLAHTCTCLNLYIWAACSYQNITRLLHLFVFTSSVFLFRAQNKVKTKRKIINSYYIHTFIHQTTHSSQRPHIAWSIISQTQFCLFFLLIC